MIDLHPNNMKPPQSNNFPFCLITFHFYDACADENIKLKRQWKMENVFWSQEDLFLGKFDIAQMLKVLNHIQFNLFAIYFSLYPLLWL